MRVLTGIVLLSLGLSGCFKMPIASKGNVSTLDESPRLAATVSATESKLVATYDPTSKVPTTFPAPSGALAGASVTLPAGALSIAVDLVVEESVPLSQTSVTGSLGLSSGLAIKPLGSGLIIRPSEEVQLAKPLTIALPIDPAVGLHGGLALASGKTYTVFYKYFEDGELKIGAVPEGSWRLTDNGSVLVDGYFGAYWLAEISAPIQARLEVKTDEPIVNKENVAVVTQTGVVTEAEVVKKASIPPVRWTGISLSLDGGGRAIKATASIEGGRTLDGCKADLFEKTDASSGINLDTGSSLSVVYTVVKKEAHSLYARFRCLDDQGRQTISPWSAAVALSGLVTPVATQDFCGATPPELRLISKANGTASATTASSQVMTALGSCVYSIDVDAMWGMGLAIQTADGKTSCYANQLQMGDQAASCVASSAAIPGMGLPQGNYTIKLDFKSGAASPKLSVSLQPCALGDLYLLSSNSNSGWTVPTAANLMTHIGGCQYTAQVNKASDSTYYSRIQNLAGTFFCGDNTSIEVHTQKTISCGTTPGSYVLSAYNPFVNGYRYILNLGRNMDINGQTTNTHYLWASEIDKCMENRYILGPTSAGSSRLMGVNSFKKNGSCTFNYAWIQGAGPFTPFFIGLGEGAEKCGVVPATYPSTSVALDCGPSAVAIDMQSLAGAGMGWRLNMSSDPVTGKPSSLQLMPLNNVCSEAYYAAKNGATGFQLDLQKALTEVSECVYQYDWTPTAADQKLIFSPAGNPGTRCGRYPGSGNPAVGGPATDFFCHSNYMMDSDVAFTPTGLVNGNRYKVTLDFRLGYDQPKISIANHTAVSCPDLYVTGLYGSSSPDPSNRMTRTGDCNYAYSFKAPAAAGSAYFRIADGGGTQCGRDIYAAYAYPSTIGETVPMACQAGTPSDIWLSLNPSAYYQILVHFDEPGQSKISIYSVPQFCNSPNFEGASAADQNGMYSRNFTAVDFCVDEMVWAPTSTLNSFLLKSNNYGYNSYCGLGAGVQPALSGQKSNALCNIFNVAQATPFSVTEGVGAGQKYLVRFDRSGSPFDAPRVSVSPAVEAPLGYAGAWLSGSNSSNVINSTTHPGARDKAAVWSPPGSRYRYMFGGYGFNQSGVGDFLGDLWRYDTVDNVWTLLPAADFGVPISNQASSMGTFDASNRPGARKEAVAVYDPSGAGRLWLFGGEGRNSAYAVGLLNDLWVYDLGTNTWAMMGGSTSNLDARGDMGSPGVPAPSNIPGSRQRGIGWFRGGQLYIFGGLGYTDQSSADSPSRGNLNDLWAFNPGSGYATSTWTFLGGDNLVNQPGTGSQPSAREGAVGWTDASGNLWMFGGLGHALNTVEGPPVGRLNDLWSYSPTSNLWTRRGGPNYAEGRMIGGLRGVSSNYIWPGARFLASAWQSQDGKFWIFGGDGNSTVNANSGALNDVWTYDPLTRQWTWVSGFTQYWSGVQVPAANLSGEYGSIGAFGPFQPGTRTGSMAFPDANGNVWIFGGLGYGSPYYGYGYLNDLWYLDF